MVATDERLRLLLIEDSAPDVELMLRALQALDRPFEHLQVQSERELRESIARFRPDVVLSDFSMPGFSGRLALEIVVELSPHTPFLFVSGTIGEEMAIEALQRGAVDYVLKDNLRRLAPAVQRALRNADERRQRQEMERALRQSEERFRSIVESSRDWIWELDAAGRLIYSNPAVEGILGYRPDSLLGLDCPGMVHPDDREGAGATLADAIGGGRPWQALPLRLLHRGGGMRVLETSGVPMRTEDGALAGFRGISRDITDSLQQEQRIRHLARLHAVLSAMGNSVIRNTDRDRLLEDLCRVAVDHGGFDAAAVALAESGPGHLADGPPPLRIARSHGEPEILACLGRLQALGETSQQERPAVRVLQGEGPVLVRDLLGGDGQALAPEVSRAYTDAGVRALATLPLGSPPWGVLGLYSRAPQTFEADELALLERLAAETDYGVDFIAKSERLEFLAYHNPVSGLPNRPALHLRLRQWLEREPAVLALLDIERFSAINESRGREFGDELLRKAGARLQALVGSAGHVAHPEADKFALLYRAAGPVETEIERLEGLLDDFQREPFEVGEEALLVDVRAGLALFPDHAADAETLERNTIAALSDGSRRGLRIHAFDDEMRGRATHRLGLEQDLRRAIDAGEFELHYQPKYLTRQQQLVGAEALLRWRHPERGLVSPAEFIPILEDTGLIVAVGRWVMAEALRTALAWRARGPGYRHLRVAVNLSARELRHRRFAEQCRELLAPHATDQALDIEVTESLLMDDVDRSLHLLDGLRDLGCRISIDDFGTGYSSLNYLARLPVDEIKIDQSFTALLTQSPETLSLVTNIIGLAHSLSLQVVAEGVEDEEQVKLLRLLRCDLLQGYWLGRPVPEADFAARLLGGATAAADCA
jgi:PAS domain S-box-containing protein/diguanylate cyclase (GGDEF)-like protein